MDLDTSVDAESTARLLHDLVEPVHLVTYFADEPTEALMALGHRNYWEGYFAGRAAPMGAVAAPVVHAVFYNFPDDEVAAHVPRIWDTAPPEANLVAREQGSAAAVRRIIGPLAADPGVESAADLAIKAAMSAPAEGRVLYAALRALPVPVDPVARLWHAATLLREHRGDGHVAALVASGIGGTEAHVLHALSQGIPAEAYGRLQRVTGAQLADVIGDMRARGLVESDGRISVLGLMAKERIEMLTDQLAASAYAALSADEIAQLASGLKPIAAALTAAGSR